LNDHILFPVFSHFKCIVARFLTSAHGAALAKKLLQAATMNSASLKRLNASLRHFATARAANRCTEKFFAERENLRFQQLATPCSRTTRSLSNDRWPKPAVSFFAKPAN
jgi:hypothetical protein